MDEIHYASGSWVRGEGSGVQELQELQELQEFRREKPVQGIDTRVESTANPTFAAKDGLAKSIFRRMEAH